MDPSHRNHCLTIFSHLDSRIYAFYIVCTLTIITYVNSYKTNYTHMSLMNLFRMLCVQFVFNLSCAAVEKKLLPTICHLLCNGQKLVFWDGGNLLLYFMLDSFKILLFCTLAIHLNINCVHKLVKHSIPRWGLLKLRSLITPLRQISIYQNNRLDDLNQLSCGDTWQTWTWCFKINVCFDRAEKFWEVTERRELAK